MFKKSWDSRKEFLNVVNNQTMCPLMRWRETDSLNNQSEQRLECPQKKYCFWIEQK